MAVFHVPLQRTVDESYDIEIGQTLLPTLVADIKGGLFPKAHRLALITDDTVRGLYGNTAEAALREQELDVALFSFPAGERSKTRETKGRIEDEMIAARFGRDSAVIALGGGVVSDLAGYLAGTFARGIPFANYATTLLAAADASIGGKTAIDTPAATNLIGLFHQPAKVYIDIDTWNTLTPLEIRNGLAETVKHACLGDANFFSFLELHAETLARRVDTMPLDANVAETIARTNCEIKYRVVQADVHEHNMRQVLNLGHTLGRALEPLANYTLNHGEAVSIGLVFQLRLGRSFGYVTEEEFLRVKTLLCKIGLPVTIPPFIKIEQLLQKMHTDKKVRKDEIRFVFQKGIGAMMRFADGSYSRSVSEKDLIPVLSESY